MQTKTYRVVRAHLGPDNTTFDPLGENRIREALPIEVAHLVPHVLEPIDDVPDDEPDDVPDDEPETPETPENKASAPAETQAVTASKRVGRTPAKEK